MAAGWQLSEATSRSEASKRCGVKEGEPFGKRMIG